MVDVIAHWQPHQRCRPDIRILELERPLSAANDTVAQLTVSNGEFIRQVADAEMRN
jgi:hypothetical protein